jgi:hypothetical protein
MDKKQEYERDRREMLVEMRSKSVLDPIIPLGYPLNIRAEIGPSTERYFHDKHRRGEFGTYYPLHVTATQAFRRPTIKAAA